MSPRAGRLIGAVAPFVGVICLAIATIVDLARGVDDFDRSLLQNSIFYLVGIGAFVLGSGHMLMPRQVAEGIGWPAHPRFQWEVGLASISYGVLGVLAPSYGHNWWLATIIAYSIFMLGAAAGHVRDMIREHNFSPGNAGPVFVLDVLAPIYLIVLYTIVT